jgi:hypothetical protein
MSQIGHIGQLAIGSLQFPVTSCQFAVPVIRSKSQLEKESLDDPSSSSGFSTPGFWVFGRNVFAASGAFG